MKVLIPKAVYMESVEKPKQMKFLDAFDVERQIETGKIIVEKIENINEKNKLMSNLRIHEGEAEAIVLFREKDADLLGIDEKRIIKIARMFNMEYITILIFIIQCFESKRLSKKIALLKLEKLQNLGYYKPHLIEYFKNKIMNGVE
jgi:predicted nucleic acid-binding protein